mgnify:CR=1 FL=1
MLSIPRGYYVVEGYTFDSRSHYRQSFICIVQGIILKPLKCGSAYKSSSLINLFFSYPITIISPKWCDYVQKIFSLCGSHSVQLHMDQIASFCNNTSIMWNKLYSYRHQIPGSPTRFAGFWKLRCVLLNTKQLNITSACKLIW